MDDAQQISNVVDSDNIRTLINTPFSACTSLIAGSLSALSQAASLVAACCIASSHIVATHLVVCTVTCLVQQVLSLVARPTALIHTLYLTNVGIGTSLLGAVIVLGCGLGRMLHTENMFYQSPVERCSCSLCRANTDVHG